MEDLTLSSPLPLSESPELPEALQTPTRSVSIGFLLALGAANAVLYICWLGGSLMLTLQISLIDPAHKVADLGIITSIAVLLALIGNPLAGALSDRTSSRFGRRRPWIFVGAITTALALALMMSAHSILQLFIGWSTLQLFSNFILAALTALIPDQVPDDQRGTASAFTGLATSLGSILGSVVIGVILKVPTPSYAFMIILVLVVFLPYTLFLRESTLPRQFVQRFNFLAFVKNFWVNPLAYPDFSFAWLTRFIPFFGYFLGTGYLFFYLQDAVHYEKLFPGQSIVQGVSILTIISTVVSLVFVPVSGILSDRIKRRKVFIITANAIIALAMVAYGFVPSWPILLLTTGVLGAGLGIYLAVDGALVTQVLPSAQNRAKDMGIVNIANTLPQSLAPAVAVFIINTTHSYFMLFLVGAIIAALGMLSVLPIKAVR